MGRTVRQPARGAEKRFVLVSRRTGDEHVKCRGSRASRSDSRRRGRPFRTAVDRLEKSASTRPAAAGCSQRDAGHVAFWDEAVVGVVIGMFRAQRCQEAGALAAAYTPDRRLGRRRRCTTRARQLGARPIDGRRARAGGGRSRGDARTIATVTDARSVRACRLLPAARHHYREHLLDL